MPGVNSNIRALSGVPFSISLKEEKKEKLLKSMKRRKEREDGQKEEGRGKQGRKEENNSNKYQNVSWGSNSQLLRSTARGPMARPGNVKSF